MAEIGKYIYGIINSNPHYAVGPYGLSACREAHFIPYQDIAAVVSDAEIVDYTRMFKDALARNLLEHQKIIEKIMSLGYSIIPMRLGTFAIDKAEVEDILTKGYALIKEIIPRIIDKIEIDVVASFSDFSATVKEAGEKKDIREFKEKLLNNPKGINVDDQMKIGFMLKKALDEKKEKYSLKIQDALMAVSINSKHHDLMDEGMIANFAFLIDKARLKDFYERIEELNTELKELINFRCVGPLPLYSFFTLQMRKMQFKEVDWARKRLGILNDSVVKDEIKKAFQRQAFSYHPDRNPDNPGIAREFDDIRKSYNILLDYAQACQQVGQESLYFNEDEFSKNAVLVKVRE